MRHFSAKKAAVGLGAGIFTLGILAGCSSSTDPNASSSPSVDAGTGSPASSDSGGTAASIQGKWRGDADELLDANTANLGSTEEIECIGPIFLTFEPNGDFTQDGTATCSVGGRSVNATIETAGKYRTDGNQLIITEAENDGRIIIPTGDVAFPGSWSEGTATYEISGDTLTIHFTGETVGAVTQKYQRAV